MSVSADACPAILGSDGAPVLVSADVVVTPVVSSSEDVVSNVGMEGAGIVVPSLSGMKPTLNALMTPWR